MVHCFAIHSHWRPQYLFVLIFFSILASAGSMSYFFVADFIEKTLRWGRRPHELLPWDGDDGAFLLAAVLADHVLAK